MCKPWYKGPCDITGHAEVKDDNGRVRKCTTFDKKGNRQKETSNTMQSEGGKKIMKRKDG